ncbi:MAG: response regulator transcription factor [Sarcina sp.]
MLKVMLVDDERLIIEGLKNIIDWESLDLEIVNTANNGEEAIEKFRENPVDIVVTDINMPKVTGLELLKGLKEINDEVKFIVLSGYDEFSYAKSAIELGVRSYLLKPVNEDELEKALKDISDDINSGHKREENLVVKNVKFIDFLNSRISVEEILEYKNVIEMSLTGKAYLTANIVANKDNMDAVMNCIRKNIISNFEMVRHHDGSMTIINCLDNYSSKDALREFYEIIRDVIKVELRTDLFIAIGALVDDFSYLAQSYKASKRAKRHILVEGYGKIIFSEDVESIKCERKSFKQEVEKLNKLIMEKKQKEASDYLRTLIENDGLTPKDIYDLSIKTVIMIDEILKEFNLEQSYGREGMASVIVDLCNENTRENIEIFLLAEIEDVIKFISDNAQVYSPVVQQVVKLINEEYKQELSLKTLAAKFRINSSYLGQIFSKEVGISFSEYLNKVKNTKAKDLILNTNMKINNIAKEVGYTDTSYFYRKFKKYYGVCPSTLREMKNY